jgi:hypothetical protein
MMRVIAKKVAPQILYVGSRSLMLCDMSVANLCRKGGAWRAGSGSASTAAIVWINVSG